LTTENLLSTGTILSTSISTGLQLNNTGKEKAKRDLTQQILTGTLFKLCLRSLDVNYSGISLNTQLECVEWANSPNIGKRRNVPAARIVDYLKRLLMFGAALQYW